MKCKMYLLNWLRNQGGSSPAPEPNLQEKSVTITTNTVTTIEPDERI